MALQNHHFNPNRVSNWRVPSENAIQDKPEPYAEDIRRSGVIIYILLYPVSKFTSALSRGILRLMGLKVNKKASEQAFTKIDLDNLIQSSIESVQNENEITDEIKIFQNALYFSEVKDSGLYGAAKQK